MKKYLRTVLVVIVMLTGMFSSVYLDAGIDYSFTEVAAYLNYYYIPYQFGDDFYFSKWNNTQRTSELWKHDGVNPAEKLFTLPSNSDGGLINPLNYLNGKLVFLAPNGSGYDLWEWDEVNPPVMISNVNFTRLYAQKCFYNNKIYFVAKTPDYGEELWSYDGMNPPVRETDMAAGTLDSKIYNLFVFKDKIMLNGCGAYGRELYEFDGVNPPRLVKDIKPGTSNSDPQSFTEMNGVLYFCAYPPNRRSMWKYDGVNEPEEISGSETIYPGELMAYNGKIYFAGWDVNHGTELWVYDGENAPRLFADINSKPGNTNSSPRYLQVVKGNLYFSADDGLTLAEGGYGNEVWMYDGINPPRMFKDLCLGSNYSFPMSSNPMLRKTGDRLYITGQNCLRNKILMFDGILAPSVETGVPTDITMSGATCGGTVTNDGGSEVTEHGIVWGTETEPTVENNKVVAGAGVGAFDVSISGLSPNTTYYIRAYAVNSKGTVYGNEETFATPSTFIDVISPNGGEELTNGSVSQVTWEASGISNPLSIYLLKDGQPIGTIVSGIAPDTTSYTWTTGLYSGGMATPGTGYSIKIEETATGMSDESDSAFSLVRNAGVSVLLVDSVGQGLAGGTVKYYDSGWKTAGITDETGKLALDLATLKSYTFRVTYAGASLDLKQDVSVNSIVVFRTVPVSVRLKNSLGSAMDTGVVSYYASGWKTMGNTISGEVRKELLPVSYTFRMSYAGASLDKKQDISQDPVVSFQTVNATVQFKDSLDNALDTGAVSYYASGWKTFGDTVSGEVKKELLPVSYTFRMTYGGASLDKKQNISTDILVAFQTVNVAVLLKDSLGNALDTGAVSYYASGWKTFGGTVSGEAKKELLPVSYTFRMTYGGASLDKKQDVSIDALVVFQTVNTVVQLKDSLGNALDTGTVSYYASGWKTFGNTVSGEARLELLPLSYTFRMSYGGGSVDLKQSIADGSAVVFQTGKVVSLSNTCVNYYASGWKTFSSSMELLPVSYTFRFSDGTPDTKTTVAVGTVTEIH